MKRSIILATLLMLFAAVPYAGGASSVFPSTNDDNPAKGYAHAQVVELGPNEITLDFSTTNWWISCIEYRTDGDTSQRLRDDDGNLRNNYNTAVTDGLYPFVCVAGEGRWSEYYDPTALLELTADEYVEIRLTFGAEGKERFDWTRFDVGRGCKDGGWADHGFTNQGQCMRYVNTDKDSR